MTRLQRLLLAAGILLLAAGLRWFDIGAEPLGIDGTAISMKALAVVRGDALDLRGPSMSVGTFHSPLSVYLYALPYALDADPRLARLYSGVFNIVAVALVYLLGRRYFSVPAGLVAALLFAVHPEAVYISRQILNIVVGLPFVLAFCLTGLLGYCEDRAWARIAHLPLLSLALQCHPASVLLAPLTAALLVLAWLQFPRRRGSLLVQTAVSAALAGALLLPWAYALFQDADFAALAGGIEVGGNRGLQYTAATMTTLLGGWGMGWVQAIQPLLTIAGTVWFVVRGVQRKPGAAGLVAVFCFFAVPVLALVFNMKYRDTYIWPEYGSAFLIQGAVIGGLARTGQRASRPAAAPDWGGWLRGRWLLPGSLLLALLAGTQLRFFATHDRTYPGPALTEHIAALRYAQELARSSGREVLATVPFSATDLESYRRWALLAEGRAVRVVWDGRALPLPAQGAIVIGPADYTGRDDLIANAEVRGRFRFAELPPAAGFAPSLALPRPVQFANGSSVLGFRPVAGVPPDARSWLLDLIWRVDAAPDADFKLFAQLVDAADKLYAQADVPALPAGQQRSGELVLSRLTLALRSALPAGEPLFIRFGVYTAAGNIKTMPDAQHAAADYAMAQVRGAPAPAAAWANGVALDSLAIVNTQAQGAPLEVRAVWRTSAALPAGLTVRWQLQTAAGLPAFAAAAQLAPGYPANEWPPGAFMPGSQLLRIPTDIAPGTYSLSLQLLDARAQPLAGEYRHAQPVVITARTRSFVPPAMQETMRATFGSELQLLGRDVLLDGRQLQLRLHWQAQQAMLLDYKFFVHVRRGAEVVAQIDSMPANYAYPTSWWARGEVVSEDVRLDLGALPAGAYTIATGFYDPASGERLAVTLADGQPSANGWVELGLITLQ